MQLSDINKDANLEKFDINLSKHSTLSYDGNRALFLDGAVCLYVNEESIDISRSEYFTKNLKSYKGLIKQILEQEYSNNIPRGKEYLKLINCGDMVISFNGKCNFFDRDSNHIERSNFYGKGPFDCKILYSLDVIFGLNVEIVPVMHQLKINDNLIPLDLDNMFAVDPLPQAIHM